MKPEQINALLGRAGRGSTVYLAGVGGCGVSGLAHLLLDAGHHVAGSDVTENEEIRQLRARGADIHIGHSAEQVRAAKPVLVVHSPVIRGDNPELCAAREMNLPVVRRALLLAALVNQQRGICVAGMHGKTTTSALLAHAFQQLGAAPSYAIGAIVPQWPAHARLSASDQSWFVAEADESDGTLREFHPLHSIVLNVDDEHLDHFANVDAVCGEFQKFIENTKELVVFCADDARVAEMMSRRPNAISYGFNPLAQYRVESKVQSPKSKVGEAASFTFHVSRFTVWHRGTKLGEFCIRLLGDKNISNAVAVITLLHQLGYDINAMADAIADFRGAARRQQQLFQNENFCVFDDYGHHPTEVRAVLSALKDLAPQRLVVVFQPHRYTRTRNLMNGFAESFGDADKLFITEIYAASEPEIPNVNSAVLSEAIRARGQVVDYVPALRDVVPAVRAALKPGDLVLFLGAGDITKAAHEMARELRTGMRAPATRDDAKAMNEISKKFRNALSPETVVRQDELLARRTTLRVGGKADFFIEPANENDLSTTLRLCAELKLPFTMIGRGSNLLIKDGGIRGVVISLGHEGFSQVQVVGEHLHTGAGAKLKTVSVEARRAGLAGLEFLEGIPGSVGGALRMNAGAMGSWMFEVVEQIRFMDFSGVAHERKASEVNVEYRGCPLFQTHIALSAVLHGTPASKEVIQERANQFNAKRWETQPAQPSAGCIFKNPKTVPAGKLIDELGLKGTKHGGAMVSTVHGNFIVNEGNATARDVLELIDFIKQTAKAKRGIDLETEVEIIGE